MKKRNRWVCFSRLLSNQARLSPQDKKAIKLNFHLLALSFVLDFIKLGSTMLKILFLVTFCGLCRARTSSDLRVHISDGRVVGRYLTSESGRTIRAFMGIPYAEPPIGNLRFKAPAKVKPWQGLLVAQQEPPMCLQKDPFTRATKVEGQEDCLFLNVYAPQVSIRIPWLKIILRYYSNLFRRQTAPRSCPLWCFFTGEGGFRDTVEFLFTARTISLSTTSFLLLATTGLARLDFSRSRTKNVPEILGWRIKWWCWSGFEVKSRSLVATQHLLRFLEILRVTLLSYCVEWWLNVNDFQAVLA